MIGEASEPRAVDRQVRRSIVRITQADSTGTGFVVAPSRVLTCHHVVSGAASPVVHVGQTQYEVEEMTLPPMRGAKPIFDLAVLRVTLPLRPAARLDPTPLTPGEALYTFGFTDLYPEGDSALFTYEGPSVEKDEQLLRLKHAQARPGLSGAPLLRHRGGIVGVVSRTRDRDSDLGARAVPIEAAFRLLPDLAAAVSAEADGATPEVGASEERRHVRRLIDIHERNVRILETQLASYSALEAPLHKQNELDQERRLIAELRARLEKLDP